MQPRLLTFIDGDDNALIVRLEADRIQLAVVDSRPELAGGELRGLATALFQTYVAAPLIAQVAAARAQLAAVRVPLAALPGGDALAPALDDALRAVAAIEATLAVPVRAPAPARRAARAASAVKAAPSLASKAASNAAPSAKAIARRTHVARGRRAGEAPAIGWGWHRRLEDELGNAAVH